MRVLPILAPSLVFFAASLTLADISDENTLSLYMRSRSHVDESDQFDLTYNSTEWDARKTAVVVCDMWDKHWCTSATKRVGEMAPRMNEVLKAARSRGALIIHCPSGTLDFYKDTPGRKLAQQAPKSNRRCRCKAGAIWIRRVKPHFRLTTQTVGVPSPTSLIGRGHDRSRPSKSCKVTRSPTALRAIT